MCPGAAGQPTRTQENQLAQEVTPMPGFILRRVCPEGFGTLSPNFVEGLRIHDIPTFWQKKSKSIDLSPQLCESTQDVARIGPEMAKV
jgi:hypothetical protein